MLGVLKAGEVLVPGTWLVIFSVRASLVLSSKLFRMSSRAIWRGRHPFLVSILFFHIFSFSGGTHPLSFVENADWWYIHSY